MMRNIFNSFIFLSGFLRLKTQGRKRSITGSGKRTVTWNHTYIRASADEGKSAGRFFIEFSTCTKGRSGRHIKKRKSYIFNRGFIISRMFSNTNEPWFMRPANLSTLHFFTPFILLVGKSSSNPPLRPRGFTGFPATEDNL